MTIDKTTNTLSTVNARGETAANRYRTTFSAPEAGVELGAVPSGERTDFIDVDPRHLIGEMYQNMVDGFRGEMTVPGGAKVLVGGRGNRISVSPHPNHRKTAGGADVLVKGVYLYAPLGEPQHLLLTADQMRVKEHQAIKTVVDRAQKAQTELDARRTFNKLQDSAPDLHLWAPGDNVDADSLVETELRAARLGYRGQNFGPAIDLRLWEPGTDVDRDIAVRDELRAYRAKFAY